MNNDGRTIHAWSAHNSNARVYAGAHSLAWWLAKAKALSNISKAIQTEVATAYTGKQAHESCMAADVRACCFQQVCRLGLDKTCSSRHLGHSLRPCTWSPQLLQQHGQSGLEEPHHLSPAHSTMPTSTQLQAFLSVSGVLIRVLRDINLVFSIDGKKA